MKLNLKTLAAYSCLIILATGCSVSKKYTRTELNLPTEFRGNRGVAADTARLTWRSFFKDSVLISLIEQSLQRNNDISVAILTLQQSEQAYKQSRLGLLPSVDFTAGTSNTWNSRYSPAYLASGGGRTTDYSNSLGLSWEVDIWRKASLQKAGALAAFFAQKGNVLALKTRIIAQVALGYYNLIALDEQLMVAKKNVALCDSTLAILQLQYGSALTNSLAINQAKSQKITAQMLVQSTLQNTAIQENAISILCGSYPDSIRRSARLTQIAAADCYSTGIPASLLSRRPDVKAAEYNVMYAHANAGLAKAAMYPSFSLTSSIGTNASVFNSWFNMPGSIGKSIGVSLTQPLFQRKALQSSLNIAVLEQEKANAQFKQAVLTAVAEVSDALAKIDFIKERTILAKGKSETLANATNDAMLLFKNGMANYLEVITVQSNALQSDLDLISLSSEKLTALVELYRALGGSE